MAIKAGQFLHDANGFVVDRIQTGGVSSLNIPQEKIYELGNYETVATVLDIPDLSFDLESIDVSTEVEALLTGQDPTATNDGDYFDFFNQMPLDVISPFKTQQGVYTIEKGIVVPYLTLESATYRFGLRQNATQSFTLKGDSVYYTPGAPFYEEFSTTGFGANHAYTLTNTATPYVESGDTLYVLSACAKNSTTHAFKRLFFGDDGYSNTSTTITVEPDLDALGYDTLHVCYGTNASISYPQVGNNPSGNTVHEGDSVKPAAVRGKDIDVYLSSGAATAVLNRWTGVQSAEIQRRINLENDEEFGNYKYVDSSFDTQDITGTIGVKSVDADDLWEKIAQVANVSTSAVAGPFSRTPLELEIRISDPTTGSVLKTIFIPDAKFTLPSVQGRVQQKLEVSFPFTSDTGVMYVYQGERP